MKNGDVQDFIESVSYANESLVLYNGKRYFFNPPTQYPEYNNMIEFRIDLWNEKDEFEDVVYTALAETPKECIKKFLSEPIIDGKTFWEIEAEMEWID